MIDPADRLPQPHPGDHAKQDMWVDEQIWGHRLWDSTSPWLIFLEFLVTAEGCGRDNRLLGEDGKKYPLTYRPRQRLALRNILFNDEKVLALDERGGDDGALWDEWLKTISDRAVAVPHRDFSYLRKRFRSFKQFAALVAMLRGCVVESESNRRWGSRFVFPFGANALYEDLNISSAGANRDYVNFGRTGELLYLMLCRSALVDELRPFVDRVVGGDNPWNGLLGLLQPDVAEPEVERHGSFLPYRRHAAFDRLAQDWLAVFRLGLPGFDAYPHLVLLGALHIMLYQLDVAAELRGRGRPSFVCEVVAPRKTLVRDQSIISYQTNEQLSAEAVDALIRSVETTPEWQAGLVSDGAQLRCREILEGRFRWPNETDKYDGSGDPPQLLSALRKRALDRHRRHAGSVHRSYGRDIGLVSKRGTNRLRYAPNDPLLKALVFCNVERRMEYREFLAQLFERYGIVFDPRAAKQVIGSDCDEHAFEANARRLEQRLSSLGLLRRLSDGCAYVQNPLSRVNK